MEGMQSFVVYNTGQLSRLNNIMNKPRETLLEKVFFHWDNHGCGKLLLETIFMDTTLPDSEVVDDYTDVYTSIIGDADDSLDLLLYGMTFNE